MDLNGNTLYEPSGMAIGKHCSNGMRVRDMVRRYNTALKTDPVKSSNTSIESSKSSYFGLNVNDPQPDDDFQAMFVGTRQQVHGPPGSPSRSSSGSGKTILGSRSPRFEAVPLENQKSFMNLSRSREPPRAAPREKKARHSNASQLPPKDDEINCPDTSYQSKTTISKTPTGVRIIVDIFFDQNKGIAMEDIVGSRIETDIPPSKILKEFQKRVAETSQD